MAFEPDTALPKMEQKCGNCYSYVADASNSSQGWCHSCPPVVLMTAPVGGAAHGNPESFWPETLEDEWCAQWKMGAPKP